MNDHYPLEDVDLIKIDVQGYEVKAFKGMTDIIEKNKDHLVILAEYSPTLLLNFEAEENGVEAFHGFLETKCTHIYLVHKQVDDQKNAIISPINSRQLKEQVALLKQATNDQGLDACLDLILLFSDAGHSSFLNKLS